MILYFSQNLLSMKLTPQEIIHTFSDSDNKKNINKLRVGLIGAKFCYIYPDTHNK